METALFTLVGTIIGGAISYLLQHQKYKQEIKALREENKTEFMAETTAKHFLNHKSFTDRSFDTLKKNLGGFEEDELRKILVRAEVLEKTEANGGVYYPEWKSI